MATPFTDATAEGFTTTDDYFAQEYMAFRDLMGNKNTTGAKADLAFGAIMLLWLNRPKDTKFSDEFIKTLTMEFQYRRPYCKES
jgi:hypothetical protein